MLKFYIFVMMLVVFLPSGCTQTGNENIATQAVDSKDKVSLFDNRVTFVPPPGLKQLGADAIKAKFPTEEFLRYAFAADAGNGEVLVYLMSDAALAPDELPKVQRFAEGTHRDYSGWLTSEIVNMNGRDWFHFEWKNPVMSELDKLVPPPPAEGEPTPVPTDDRLFHYNEYTTSFDGKHLRFVFKSLENEYPKLKDVFAKSASSLEARQ